MNATHSKKRNAPFLADLAAWERDMGEDNAQQLERLTRNLRLARVQELTPRQQQVLTLFFEQDLNITQIARELGLHRTTVSRTLQRAKQRLYRSLRYTF